MFGIISWYRDKVRLMFELSWHLLMSMFSMVFSTTIFYQVVFIDSELFDSTEIQKIIDNNCIKDTYYSQFAIET